ncbi:MAG: DUF6644 family protein [Terracidiphilus sp.]
MSLLKFCHWIGRTHLGIFMRDSTYAFAIVEICHLLALAVFGGAILLVNLRFLGVAFKLQPISLVARELLPLTGGGVVAMFISGFLLFMGGSMRYYHNPAFRLKMILFVVALVFHFFLQVRASRQSSELSLNSNLLKLGSVVSLLLWFSIGLAGRAIGYV